MIDLISVAVMCYAVITVSLSIRKLQTVYSLGIRGASEYRIYKIKSNLEAIENSGVSRSVINIALKFYIFLFVVMDSLLLLYLANSTGILNLW